MFCIILNIILFSNEGRKYYLLPSIRPTKTQGQDTKYINKTKYRTRLQIMLMKYTYVYQTKNGIDSNFFMCVQNMLKRIKIQAYVNLFMNLICPHKFINIWRIKKYIWVNLKLQKMEKKYRTKHFFFVVSMVTRTQFFT